MRDPRKRLPRVAQVPEAAHGRAGDPLRVGIAFGMLVAAVALGAVVGLTAGDWQAGEGESEAAEFLGGFNGIAPLVIGVVTLFLGWALSGRWLLQPLGETLRRHRVGIHTWSSLAALAMVLIHTVGLLARKDTRGWASGAASALLFVALFATGWWRPFYVRKWGLRTWRWVHWELALGALLLGFEHWLILEHAKELALELAN
ncbi:MAG TPA: hypothetical protein VM327_06690 [Candidatus Thermoplasmatota archaeon]|nr:hypothetical protein [Candidatus Thermoplasmatota archaeon]